MAIDWKERDLIVERRYAEFEAAARDRREAAQREAAKKSNEEAEALAAQAEAEAEYPDFEAGELYPESDSETGEPMDYDGAELSTQVRDSARTQSEDSLGGKPSVATQIASDREDTPEKGPQPVYTPDGPRVSFGGHSERKSAAGARAKASDGGGLLGPRRGRQIKQGIGRIWYGLTRQDEKQAGIIASQESQDLRGKAVKAGLVTPDEVRDEVTADTLLANAIQYLNPSIPAHKRGDIGTPRLWALAKRKEDLARRIITQARNRSESALGDAWKHVPEDLREGAHKALGLEYDAVSPAERAAGGGEETTAVSTETDKEQYIYDTRAEVPSPNPKTDTPEQTAAWDTYMQAIADGDLDDQFEASHAVRRAFGRPVFSQEKAAAGASDSPTEEPASARVDPAKLSAEVADSIIYIESKGKADAKNPKSSATGLYQFVDGTWLEMINKYRPDLKEGKNEQEILDLRLDPAISREIGLKFTEGNIKGMQSAGIKVTRGKVYLAHFLGLGGAKRLLTANPNARVDTVMSRAAMKNNRSLLVKNGKAITVQQFIDWAEKKMA